MNKITYAVNQNGELIYVDNVPNGSECHCVCPGCHEKMVAKNNGKIRMHHFAHISGTECVNGYETMKHLLAKEIITETRLIPWIEQNRYTPIPSVRMIKETEHTINNIKIIPDITAWIQTTPNLFLPIFIEIYVTHKTDEEKLSLIKKAEIPAIEIDLSKSNAQTKEELMNDIYNPQNLKILNATNGKQFIPQIQVIQQYLATRLLQSYAGRFTTRNHRSPYKSNRPYKRYHYSRKR